MQDLLNNPGGLVPEKGYPGMGDMNPCVSVSRINESVDSSGVGIDFGVAVAYGASNDGCKVFGADTDKLLGFSERYVTTVYDQASGQVSFHQGESLPVRRFGRLLVLATENTTMGDQVIVKTASRGALGSTTGGAAGTGRVAATGARWMETVSAGQLAWIEFNLLGTY